MWRAIMDNLFLMFIFQVILWIILFFLIFYLRKEDSEIRRDLKLLKDAWEKKGSGS
jgi:hypothetical protein